MQTGEALIFGQIKKIIDVIFGKEWTLGHGFSIVTIGGAFLFMMSPSSSLKNHQEQAQLQNQEMNFENNLSIPESNDKAIGNNNSEKELEWELGSGIVKDRKNGQLTGFFVLYHEETLRLAKFG